MPLNISTSKDLLKIYPFLEGQEGWTKFADRYDKEECIKEREKAALAVAKPRRSKIIRALRAHCASIIQDEELAIFPKILHDGTAVYLSPARLREARLKKAIQLAKKIEWILIDAPGSGKWRDAITQEIKRSKTIQPLLNIVEALKALVAFINREQTLPTKQQLNWEANHIAYGQKDRFVAHLDSKEEGKKVIENGKAYWTYGYYDDYRMDGNPDNGEGFFGLGYKLVPEDKWKHPRWDDLSNASHIWKKCGLSGLPEANRCRVGRHKIRRTKDKSAY